MTEKENNNRNKLKLSKPKVYEKVIKYNMPRIQYQALYDCNFSCTHCSVKKVKDKNRKELSLEEIKNVFDQADEMGISRITISGGEPLLHKDLDKLIETIDASRFWLQLDTNCWLFTREKAKELKELGIDCIAPSLDSLFRYEHDSFRNKIGSSDKVREAFDIIKEVNFFTYVQTVVGKTRLYSNEFEAFLDYFNSRGIGVFVSFAKPVGAYEGHFEELIDRNDLKYFEKLEKEYNCFSHLTPAYGINEERNCVASRNIFGLNCYGDVLPCIYYYVSMGNVLEEPLKDIYERCIKLKPFQINTCPLADKSCDFIKKYLVPIYGKKLPVSYKEIFKEEDFE